VNDDSYERADVPDFTQLLMQRVQQKTIEAKPAPNGFDPYQAMLNRKKVDDGEPVDTSNVVKWPEKDVKALEDFCAKYAVLGFNCGKMSPIAALAMLKNMMGIVEGPLEDRVPAGYEKRGTPSKYNAHFPYEQIVTKKTLLNG
jgi:hypothetical protein